MKTFYERVGGEVFFNDLVSNFYGYVVNDPILRPMYPEDGLKAAGFRLQKFLEQYWGGPKTYSEERGHPRLRMRHAGFHINSAARDAWLNCMRQVIEAMEMETSLREELWSYLEMAAGSMVNQSD